MISCNNLSFSHVCVKILNDVVHALINHFSSTDVLLGFVYIFK